MKRYIAKIFICVLAVVLIFTVISCKTTTPAETTEKQKFLIGFSSPWGKSPFVTNTLAGANKAIEDWNEAGIEVELVFIDAGDLDISKQIGDLEDLYNQGIDGLIIIAGDPNILVDPLRNIYNANDIPIVPFDAGLYIEGEELEIASTVLNANYLGGEMAAEWLATQDLPEGSNVALLQNAPTFKNNQEKMAGFVDKITEIGGFDLLPEKVVEFTLEDGKRVMEDVLTSNPDIDVVYTLSQIIARGCLSALEEQDRTDVLQVSWDFDKASLELAMEGKLPCLIAQDPYSLAYESINQVIYYLTDDSRYKDLVLIEPELVTTENASDFTDSPMAQS